VNYRIFIIKEKIMDELINRRIWDKDRGLCYFCTICGAYQPQKQFYKSNRTKWGVHTSCKIHHTKKEKDDDGSSDHLKFTKVKEEDFIGARNLLKKLGYDTTDPHNSIHQQFLDKHKLNIN